MASQSSRVCRQSSKYTDAVWALRPHAWVLTDRLPRCLTWLVAQGIAVSAAAQAVHVHLQKGQALASRVIRLQLILQSHGSGLLCM